MMNEKRDWSKCTGDGLDKYSPCAFRDLLRRVEDLEEFSDAVKEYFAARAQVNRTPKETTKVGVNE